MITQHLQAGFCHIGVHFVAHAAGEERHLEPASAAGFVKRAVAGMQRCFCQGVDVAVAQHEVEQRRAHGALRVVARAKDKALHGRANAHGEVEEARLGQKRTEDHLLDRVQADELVYDFTGFHEDVHNLDAGRAGRLAGTAQKAAAQFFGHSRRVLNHLMGQVVNKGQLAASHVGFHTGGAEHGAHGLAHAAFHAGSDPVVQGHKALGQFVHSTHETLLERLNFCSCPVAPALGGQPPEKTGAKRPRLCNAGANCLDAHQLGGVKQSLGVKSPAQPLREQNGAA